MAIKVRNSSPVTSAMAYNKTSTAWEHNNITLINRHLRMCLLLLLSIHSAHLEIFSFPMAWVVLTNTGIFLHGLKLCGESRT